MGREGKGREEGRVKVRRKVKSITTDRVRKGTGERGEALLPMCRRRERRPAWTGPPLIAKLPEII